MRPKGARFVTFFVSLTYAFDAYSISDRISFAANLQGHPCVSLAAWSSGMIVASAARGPGLNSWSNPFSPSRLYSRHYVFPLLFLFRGLSFSLAKLVRFFLHVLFSTTFETLHPEMSGHGFICSNVALS